MPQSRLNNVMVLHAHKSLDDKVSSIDISNDFICCSSQSHY